MTGASDHLLDEPALVGPSTEERAPVTVSWHEFMELKPARRKNGRQPAAASLSLFEWAMGLAEQEAAKQPIETTA